MRGNIILALLFISKYKINMRYLKKIRRGVITKVTSTIYFCLDTIFFANILRCKYLRINII